MVKTTGISPYINENLEYILQEVTENNNDFGIQKIRDFIENRKAYGDFD